MRTTPLVLASAFVVLCGCGTSPPPSPTPTGAATAPTAVATSDAAPSTSSTASPAPAVDAAGSFFPLVVGSRYTYFATFNGREFNSTVLVRRAQADGQELYYFVNELDATDANPYMGSSNIGDGAYAMRADGVYVAPVGFLAKVQGVSAESMQLMLALPPKVKAKTSVEVDPNQHWSHDYVVDAIETVNVPAGTFQGSARLTLTSVADDGSETSKIWLAPGVGLVRWERASGRVDELVSYEIPR